MTGVLLSYVINAVWQVPLAAVAALALTRIARPSPALCSRMLAGLLLLTVLAPAIASALQVFSSVFPPIVSPAPNSAASAPPLPMTIPPSAQEVRPFEFAQWQAGLILAALTVAIAIAGARLILAAVMTRTWLRQSRPIALPHGVMQDLRRFAECSGIAPPRVHISEFLATPAVAGMFKPIIMIPEHLADLEPEPLRAVLLHECAHVARRDYAANWACEILSLPLCWHPFLTILKRELRMAREMACDEMAAASMASSAHYATGLLQVAQSGLERRNPRLFMVPALIGNGDLERRIKAIMSPERLSRFARMSGTGITAALFAAIGAVVALLHVTPAVAQDHGAGAKAAFVPATAAVATGAPAPATATASANPAESRGSKAPSPQEDKPAVVESGETQYAHHWVSASGRRYSIVNDTPSEPTAEQKRGLEPLLDRAQAEASKMRKRMEDPRFVETMKWLQSPAFKAEAGRAAALQNDPQVRSQLARAKAMIANGEVQRDLERAAQSLRTPSSDVQTDTRTDVRTDAQTSAPPQARQWRPVAPGEMPIARGNEALKLLPNGTVLFSPAPGG